jgi:TonB-dependent receptor
VNGLLNKHLEHGDQNDSQFSTAQSVATRDATGALIGTGAIVPEYTRNMTEWRPVTASQVNVNSTSTEKGGDTQQLQIGGVHRFNAIEIDYSGFRSKSVTDYPGNAAFGYTARGIGMRIERKESPFFPTVTQIAGPDIRNIENYTDNVLTITRMRADDKYVGGEVNVKMSFREPVPAFVKAGVKLREQTRLRKAPTLRYRFAGPDRLLNSGDENLAQFLNPSVISNSQIALPYPAFTFRDADDVPYSYPVRTNSYGYSGYNIGTALYEKPEQFQEDVAFNVTNELNTRVNFTESINSAYVMGNVDIARLSILAGVRVEETETEGNGALRRVTPEELARRLAFVGPITDDELRRRTTEEYSGRVTASGKYKKVFPGVHFKYELPNGLLLRLSYATNIGRVQISELIPATFVNDELQTVTTTNPGLKPQYSDNFDFGVEYYFEPVGRLSAGAFLKEITDFQFSAGGQRVGSGPNNGFDGAYEGYSLTTRMNGGAARIRGFELAYQQQFTFLPGWWKGFGVFANYTRLDAKGDYGTGRVGSTNSLAGFIPEIGNLGISYIRQPLTLRFQFNHVGKYLSSYNANPALLRYQLQRDQLDIKSAYWINRHYSVYLDVYNVFVEAERGDTWFGGLPRNIRKEKGPLFVMGIKGSY